MNQMENSMPGPEGKVEQLGYSVKVNDKLKYFHLFCFVAGVMPLDLTNSSIPETTSDPRT